MVFSLSFAQEKAEQLSYADFLKLVYENHPWMQKAENIALSGEAIQLMGKGGFDPELIGSVNQKYFNGSKYYSYLNGGLTIPTWYGIKVNTGYDQNLGEYISLSNRTPNAGLWYAGVEVNLGNGLLMDERRATLKKAKLFHDYSIEEAKIKRNEVLYQASVAYWNWFSTYHTLESIENVVETSKLRFENLSRNAELGEIAIIDTVEASIQYANRRVAYEKAQYEYFQAQQQLNTFLWLDGFIPLEIGSLVPEAISSEQINLEALREDSTSTIISNHPYLKMNQLKLDQIQIDLRLKQEYLKPKLALKYNAIAEPIGGDPLSSYSPNNYTWGATFAYPILTREERGNVKLQKLKLENQELDLMMNQRTLERDILSAKEKVIRYNNLTVNYFDVVENYDLLYQGEQRLFDAGESNLFMINAREVYFLDGKIGLVNAIAEYKIANAGYLKTIVELDQLVN